MKFKLPTAVSNRVARVGLVAQKHSPQILFYSGLGLMAATVVTSSTATLKLEGVLDDMRRDREDLRVVSEKMPEKYTPGEAAKIERLILIKGTLRVFKLYLPAITLGVAAVACLTTSHNQLTRRNAGLSAALAATERALESYRNRVRAEVGEDKELEIWRGVEEKTLEVEGKKTNDKVKVGGGYSQYARVWGRDTSNEWDPHPEYNLAKLRSVQEWCTLKLNHRGHLFLNEVFDELGLERMPYGAVVGWLSEKYGGVDGYVDFGVLKRNGEVEFLDFVTGREDHIMLDFNVDGEIWRKI